MATYCTGVTVSWDSVSLGEVTDIKATVGGGLPLARGSTASATAWAFDAGVIDIACLSSAQLTVVKYGKKATLDISGGGINFTTKAIMQSFQMAGKVNDIARYAVTFKIALE